MASLYALEYTFQFIHVSLLVQTAVLCPPPTADFLAAELNQF